MTDAYENPLVRAGSPNHFLLWDLNQDFLQHVEQSDPVKKRPGELRQVATSLETTRPSPLLKEPTGGPKTLHGVHQKHVFLFF